MDPLRHIWNELGAKLRAFIGNRVNDSHDADDVTQDVLLKVQTRVGGLPAGDKLPAWVFAVARNAVIDYYRARAAHATTSAPDAALMPAAPPDERETAVRELTPCLTRMIQLLPEPYRTAMRLADLEGLPHQALAERTGVSLTAAKSRVRRARQQLREMILDCCHVERDARGGVMDYQTTERSPDYCGGGGQGLLPGGCAG